jgi:phosphatidylserine decarboxylase
MDVKNLLGLFFAVGTALVLAWKWQLGLIRVGLTVALLGVLAGRVVSTVARSLLLSRPEQALLVWALTLGAAFVILAYCFYRDPERSVPNRADIIVSPADGTVVYVLEAKTGLLPVSAKKGRECRLEELTKTRLAGEDAFVVGIGMNFLDVHVNRAPISGEVSFQRHFSGLFGSLRDPEMILQNERATTVFDQNDFQVAVIQIASRLVRRIDVFVRTGERVVAGQRIGVIRFGSQVDVVIPARENVKIMIRQGDRVRAAESILAIVGPNATPPEATKVTVVSDHYRVL